MNLGTMREEDFADVFQCSRERELHSYYYIAPEPASPDGLLYRVNRTGIELQLPEVFHVERKSSTAFCQIFCIFSGKGELQVRGRTWELHENQVVLLSAGEAHSYSSSAACPLGMVWLEFSGGDSRRLMEALIGRLSPVVEGPIVQTVCTGITEVQQKLMMQEDYQPSREIYELLFQLLVYADHPEPQRSREDVRQNLRMAELYVEAHLHETISNGRLAELCGVSTQYFARIFKAHYHMTPQQYAMGRRMVRAKYLLTRSALPVEAIALKLGFCNASHFIRRFHRQEAMTPAAYRRQFASVAPGPGAV